MITHIHAFYQITVGPRKHNLQSSHTKILVKFRKNIPSVMLVYHRFSCVFKWFYRTKSTNFYGTSLHDGSEKVLLSLQVPPYIKIFLENEPIQENEEIGSYVNINNNHPEEMEHIQQGVPQKTAREQISAVSGAGR